MLYQAIRDLVYSTISDDEDNQFFITTGQMEAFANKALRQIIEETEHKDCDVEWTIGQGTSTISIGDTLSRMSRIEVDYQPLRPTTQSELRGYGIDWRSHEGLPRYYYGDGLVSIAGGKVYGVYPAPSATYNLRVTYICTPADVVLAEDMEIPEWCAEAVAWSMLADIYKVDTEIMNLDVSSFYDFLFKGIVRRIRARSFDRLPKAWAYKTGPTDGQRLSIWNNLPEEIPSP